MLIEAIRDVMKASDAVFKAEKQFLDEHSRTAYRYLSQTFSFLEEKREVFGQMMDAYKESAESYEDSISPTSLRVAHTIKH